jgi:hypothetical protein
METDRVSWNVRALLHKTYKCGERSGATALSYLFVVVADAGPLTRRRACARIRVCSVQCVRCNACVSMSGACVRS